MRARLPCVLLALGLLVGLPGLALAQGALNGGVRARFEPVALEVPLGAMGTARLVLENNGLQPRTANVTYLGDARVTVQMEGVGGIVAPGDAIVLLVHAYPSAALAPQNLTLRFRVQDAATGGLDPREQTVDLPLAIVAKAPPAGTPLLTPRTFPETVVAPNQTRNLTLSIRHDAPVNQTYRLQALAPRGWIVTASETNVQPNATGFMRLGFRPMPHAEDGVARLLVKNNVNASHGAVAEIPLVLLRPDPPPGPPPAEEPPADDPPADEADPQPTPAPGGQPGAGAGNATGGNATSGNATRSAAANATSPADESASPPPQEDAADAPPAPPPEDEAEQAEPDDAPAEPVPLPPVQEDAPPEPDATGEAAAPPPRAAPRGLRMRVEPAVVSVAPGSVADARLVLESDVALAVRVGLDLPPGLAGSLSARAIAVPAGQSVEVPLLLQADPALPNGTRLDARVEALDGAAEAAHFQVLVTLPEPPVELVSLSAPGTAGGHAFGGGALPLSLLAAGVGAASLLWTKRRWALAFAGLYARLRPSAVMEHPVRQRLATLVQERPGLSMREAQRELDLANGAMTYHLRTLEKAGIVRVVPDGMLRRVYPAGHPRVAPVPPLHERVLAIVRERGEATPTVVAEALGVSRQSVHYHLQKMVREGRLRARVHGRETYLRMGDRESPSSSA